MNELVKAAVGEFGVLAIAAAAVAIAAFAAFKHFLSRYLEDKKDDLDGSHTLRRLFGALAVGTYGYNLLDVLVLGGGEAAAPVSLEALPVPGEPGLALVWRF